MRELSWRFFLIYEVNSFSRFFIGAHALDINGTCSARYLLILLFISNCTF